MSSVAAFEEIGLPIDYEKVRLLTLLSPVLAPNDLLVTPVVVYMTDISYKVRAQSFEYFSMRFRLICLSLRSRN